MQDLNEKNLRKYSVKNNVTIDNKMWFVYLATFIKQFRNLYYLYLLVNF